MFWQQTTRNDDPGLDASAECACVFGGGGECASAFDRWTYVGDVHLRRGRGGQLSSGLVVDVHAGVLQNG